MKSKTLVILAGIFLILILVSVYPLIQPKIRPSTPEINNELPFQVITENSTTKISIKNNKENFDLLKGPNNWKVSSFSASQKNIEDFFSALKSSTVENLVSKNSDNSTEYGIASDSGVYLSLTSNNTEQQFVIGKEGPDNGSFYAKKQGSPHIYLVHGPLKDTLKTAIDDWRNKTIVAIPADSVVSIEVSGENGFVVKKNDSGKWELHYKDKLKELGDSDLSSTFSSISDLQGREFLKPEEEKEFSIVQTKKLIFKNKDQKIISEITFIDREGDFWMKRNDSNEILKVSGYKLQDFFKLTEKI